jgi:transposase
LKVFSIKAILFFIFLEKEAGMGKERRLSMRKIKEILRLKFDCDLSNRGIARSCSISHSTVGDYISRFEESGLSWPLPAEVDELSLEWRLFPLDSMVNENVSSREPDWKSVHEELRKKGVTLLLLWREYLSENRQGYKYSRFCELYKQWKKKLQVSMRQTHRAGEKMFVDYCGQTVEIRNGTGADVSQAQIFVAVLGASNYIFAEAHYKQDIAHWLGGHIRGFEFFGGVPEVVVPDNLKAGVKSPCRYEPVINPSYNDMAKHYQVAVIPARVRKPKDKSKAEVGVQVVQRWILAVLRKRTFFSLYELNQAIKELLVELNNREMRHLGKSRKELFDNLEKPMLKPLPQQPYTFWEWKKVKVPPDYHVKFDNNYYSIPSRYVEKSVDIRANQHLVEIYFKDKVIAYHKRSYEKNFVLTEAKHMPKKHRVIAEVNAQHLMNWSEKVGPKTNSIIGRMLSSEIHPEQTYRKCLGVLRLGGRYGEERLEAACNRALHFGVNNYKGIESMLKNGCDKLPLCDIDKEQPPNHLHHENIRGSHYYHREVATC